MKDKIKSLYKKPEKAVIMFFLKRVLRVNVARMNNKATIIAKKAAENILRYAARRE